MDWQFTDVVLVEAGGVDTLFDRRTGELLVAATRDASWPFVLRAASTSGMLLEAALPGGARLAPERSRRTEGSSASELAAPAPLTLVRIGGSTHPLSWEKDGGYSFRPDAVLAGTVGPDACAALATTGTHSVGDGRWEISFVVALWERDSARPVWTSKVATVFESGLTSPPGVLGGYAQVTLTDHYVIVAAPFCDVRGFDRHTGALEFERDASDVFGVRRAIDRVLLPRERRRATPCAGPIVMEPDPPERVTGSGPLLLWGGATTSALGTMGIVTLTTEDCRPIASCGLPRAIVAGRVLPTVDGAVWACDASAWAHTVGESVPVDEAIASGLPGAGETHHVVRIRDLREHWFRYGGAGSEDDPLRPAEVAVSSDALVRARSSDSIRVDPAIGPYLPLWIARIEPGTQSVVRIRVPPSDVPEDGAPESDGDRVLYPEDTCIESVALAGDRLFVQIHCGRRRRVLVEYSLSEVRGAK